MVVLGFEGDLPVDAFRQTRTYDKEPGTLHRGDAGDDGCDDRADANADGERHKVGRHGRLRYGQCPRTALHVSAATMNAMMPINITTSESVMSSLIRPPQHECDKRKNGTHRERREHQGDTFYCRICVSH